MRPVTVIILSLLLATTVSAQMQELWQQDSVIADPINNSFGLSIDSGDFDGDGFPDVLVANRTANSYLGAAYVFSGDDRSLLYSLSGGLPGGIFGLDVAAGGDIDLDGCDDFVVSSSNTSASGTNHVRVYSGQTGQVIATKTGSTGDRFGEAVCIADFDGDGFSDLLVGAPRFDNGAAGSDQGRVTLYFGPGLSSSTTFTGLHVGDRLGDGLANLGDIDGNGTEDVAMSAPGFDGSAGADSGRVYIRGRISILITTLGVLDGLQAGDAVTECAAVGDVDGDGLVDVGVGYHGAARGSISQAGTMQVWSRAGSSSWSVIRNYSGVVNGGHLGGAFGAVGDVDGDGRDDFAMTAGRDVPGSAIKRAWVDVRSGMTDAVIWSRELSAFSGKSDIVPMDLNDTGLPGFVVGDEGSDRFMVHGWPQSYRLPGSGDDLVLRTAVGGLDVNRDDVKQAAAADLIAIRFRSPGHTYDLSVPVLTAQVMPAGVSPGSISIYPELHLDLSYPVIVLIDGNATPFGSLLGGGADFHMTVPAQLAGTDLIFQGICLQSSAVTANPFTTTEAHTIEIR